QCAFAFPTAGTRTVQASYAGTADYAASNGSISQVVNKANTTTAVVSSVNPSVVGQQVTYTATVTANSPGSGTPSGTVTFKDGGSSINGSCESGSNTTLSAGSATCKITYPSAGSHSITVDY